MPLYTNWEQNSVFAFFRRFVNTINFTGIVFNSGFNHYINSHCRKFYRIFATQKDVSSISLRPHCLLSASLVPIASLSCLYSAAILSPSFSSLRQLIVSPKTGLYRPQFRPFPESDFPSFICSSISNCSCSSFSTYVGYHGSHEPPSASLI